MQRADAAGGRRGARHGALGGPVEHPCRERGRANRRGQSAAGRGPQSFSIPPCTPREGGCGADPRAASRRTAPKPVVRPLVVTRPDRRRPLLAIPGRPAPPPIGADAYVPIGGGVRGRGGRREARLQYGHNALRRGEEGGAGSDQRGRHGLAEEKRWGGKTNGDGEEGPPPRN